MSAATRIQVSPAAAVVAAVTFALTMSHAVEVKAGDADPAKVQPVATLQEVIVSARKVKENLQRVPISITAFSGTQLQSLGAQSITDVAKFTPNLGIDSTAAVSGSTIASTIFIRGVGQTDFTLNSDPGVGVYLDGVYLARSVGSLLDLVDTQSVQVLRGPQGTLFGMNTIGGAIVVTSNPPSSEGGGHVEVQGGNFARHDAKLDLNAPISDTLLTSLSVGSLNEDGYQQRILQPGSADLGDEDRLVVRGRALWKPVDNFSADAIVDYSRGREQSVPQSVLQIIPNTGAPFIPAAAGLIPGTTATIRPQYAGQFTGADLLDGTFITNNPDISYYGGPSRSDFDILGESLTLTYQVGAYELKNIAAYRRLDSNFARDSLSSPFLVADTYDAYSDKQFSDELRLTHQALNSRLTYVAGLFFFRETGTDSNLVATSIGGLESGGSVNNHSIAAYTQATLKITPELSATAGLRYTDVKKGFEPGYDGGDQQFVSNSNGLALGLPPALPLIRPGDYVTRENHVDYTGALQYQWTEGFMTYMSYSTGFKSGGFNQRIGPGGSGIPSPSFNPETVGVVEVGLKWVGLDNHLRINGDVFHTNYSNVQITPLFEDAGPVTANAGDGKVDGSEIELALLPNRHWEFDAGIGLLDTRYTSLSEEAQTLDLRLDGSPALTLDSRFAKSPRRSFNGIATHTWDLPGNNLLSLSVNASYTSLMYNDVLNSPALERPGMTLWGASLIFKSADGHWVVAAHGVNLSNKQYIISGNSEIYIGDFGYTQATYARPREWWISIDRYFDR